ncbi:MAG TPA: hypothetical protein VIY52_19615 [Streptosporangiaceae bacterium]
MRERIAAMCARVPAPDRYPSREQDQLSEQDQLIAPHFSAAYSPIMAIARGAGDGQPIVKPVGGHK